MKEENERKEATDAKNYCKEEKNERDESGSGKDNVLERFEKLRLGMQEHVLIEEHLKF